ncbi:MAG: restriction endonuclease [Desulfobacteraceae bacterium]|nr:MAG: restriction endonuclease [Desulfobacteraceae bacterium]
MDFAVKIQDLSSRIKNQIEHIQTEEATKNAFIMPFISALGYDVFNPLEVIPEFTADIGIKKGEKVDYAVKKDGAIVMLFECKWCGCDLDKMHCSQLYRYFSTTEARFGILTNGIHYRFFSDIDQPNKMDEKPFFEFNIQEFEDHQLEELKKFAKSSFDLENILTTANELKYTNSIKRILSNELTSPSSEFVRFFGAQVYQGRMTQPVIDQFSGVVKKAFAQFVKERVNERLKSALHADGETKENKGFEQIIEAPGAELQQENCISTTVEEEDAFNIVKAIVREIVDVKRVFLRDRVTYCGILLDDNNRKPITRLHFNSQNKRISIFKQNQEEKVFIETLDDIFKYADQLKATVLEYSR